MGAGEEAWDLSVFTSALLLTGSQRDRMTVGEKMEKDETGCVAQG